MRQGAIAQIRPHAARGRGDTGLYYQRTAALFTDNLERLLSTRPLANGFERERVY